MPSKGTTSLIRHAAVALGRPLRQSDQAHPQASAAPCKLCAGPVRLPVRQLAPQLMSDGSSSVQAILVREEHWFTLVPAGGADCKG